MMLESNVPTDVKHILEVRSTGWALGDDCAKDGLYPGLMDATKAIFEEAYVNGADAEKTLIKAEEKAAEVITENQ